jgi:hypothetical protein
MTLLHFENSKWSRVAQLEQNHRPRALQFSPPFPVGEGGRLVHRSGREKPAPRSGAELAQVLTDSSVRRRTSQEQDAGPPQ